MAAPIRSPAASSVDRLRTAGSNALASSENAPKEFYQCLFSHNSIDPRAAIKPMPLLTVCCAGKWMVGMDRGLTVSPRGLISARTGRLAIADPCQWDGHQAPRHGPTPDHLPYGPSNPPAGQARGPNSRQSPRLAGFPEADAARASTCGAGVGGAGAGHVHEKVSSPRHDRPECFKWRRVLLVGARCRPRAAFTLPAPAHCLRRDCSSGGGCDSEEVQARRRGSMQCPCMGVHAVSMRGSMQCPCAGPCSAHARVHAVSMRG